MTKEIPALRNEERGLFFSMLNSEGGIAIFISLIRERTCNLQ